MSRDDPHLAGYREYVAGGGYSSIEVPLDDGVVLSARRRVGTEAVRLGEHTRTSRRDQ